MTRVLALALLCAASSTGAILAALTPPAGEVEAREGNGCIQSEVSVDEGYGVSAIETRRICRR